MTFSARRHLYFRDFESRRGFHAAWVGLGLQTEAETHDHDFWEWFLVVGGSGTHRVNGSEEELATGDLRLIRPADFHSFSSRTRLEIINVAFPPEDWDRFLGTIDNPLRFRGERLPPGTSLREASFREGRLVLEKALHLYQEPPLVPDGLVLHQMWSTLLAFLWPGEEEAVPCGEMAPDWLRRALWQMRREENLRGGVERLRSLAAVSASHLARTVRSHTGQTPTDLVNDLRLQHAARLLRTGNLSINETALRCGFENLTYFYRLFGRRFGCAPRAYRQGAQRAVAP